MRNLTIKRTKTFVGCLAKAKIYIEDASANDIVINDTPCRKLGELKNNEEKTFEIGKEQAKVFVIFDKITKNFCNDYYQLPDGQEDVYLSGKNHFNMTNGNAFLFDNNENKEVRHHRKKASKKGAIILATCATIGFIVGYIVTAFILSEPKDTAKSFSGSGISITLTNEFKEGKIEGFTNSYSSPKVAVFMQKEEFTLLEGLENYTLEEYGNLVIQNNGLTSSLKNVDGLTCFDYEFLNPLTNSMYTYFSYVYKASDAFWLVQFATPSKNTDEYGSKITEWAKTVSFEQQAIY